MSVTNDRIIALNDLDPNKKANDKPIKFFGREIKVENSSKGMALGKSIAFAIAGIALIILSAPIIVAGCLAIAGAPLTLGGSIAAGVALGFAAGIPFLCGVGCFALSEANYRDYQNIGQFHAQNQREQLINGGLV